ncbi:YSIRK-type signal peptide-containing protein [Staphylococcus simulans]|uniref:YSIRK-type signal peptide-containing protein n=1 Tax=Staphylococcus simulans TaxID=1286 RepID=UPI00399A2A8D
MKKKQLFSLRKLSVGIASVSLGTLVFLGGGQTVSAETQDLNQKTLDAYNTINNLPSLTDAQKDAYNQQILEQSGQNNSNFDAILNEAQTNNTQAAQNINAASQDAYNTINNLPSLTDAQKDAYNQQILEAAGTNNANFDAILAEAQTSNDQAAQDINTASQDAYNTINNLPSLTDAQKDAYNQQILEAAGANNTNFDMILAEAQKVNDQAAQDINTASQDAYNKINNLPSLTDAQKDAYNQRILEVAGTNSTDFATILDEAQKVNDQAAQDINAASQDAYNTINNLPSLTDAQKDAYNQRILEVAGTNSTDFAAILDEAQKANDQAAQDINQASLDAYNTINNLPNLTDAQKDAFNQRILEVAGTNSTDFAAILDEAKALDAKLAPDEKDKAEDKEQQDDSSKEEAKPEEKEQQDDSSKEEAKPENKEQQDGTAKEKDQPKEDAKAENKTDKKDVEKAIGEATDEKASLEDRTQSAHDAVNKLANLTQKQKDAYNAAIDKSAKEDKGAQFEAILNKAKDEDAKVAKETAEAKELPATGESDEVLFGLLSGSLFASAGTLFLLNARRKENK